MTPAINLYWQFTFYETSNQNTRTRLVDIDRDIQLISISIRNINRQYVLKLVSYAV